MTQSTRNSDVSPATAEFNSPYMQLEQDESRLTVVIRGNEVFGPHSFRHTRPLFDYMDQCQHQRVVLDLRLVNYFCSSGLGRLADFITLLQEKNLDLTIRASAYSYNALRASGFDRLINIERS